MSSRNVLVLVDFQNDFMLRPSLMRIPAAVDDAENVIGLLGRKPEFFDLVLLTGDRHPSNHVGFNTSWKIDGKTPEPFGVVTKEWFNQYGCDLVKGRTPMSPYPVDLWPEHCVKNTSGSCVYQPLLQAVERYTGKPAVVLWKGEDPDREEYAVPEERWRNILPTDRVFIAGEAYDMCVAATVDVLVGMQGAGRVTILKDCTSTVSCSSHGDLTEEMKFREKKWEESGVTLAWSKSI